MKQILRVVTAAVLVVLLSWGSVTSGFAQGGAGRPFITKWQVNAGEELKFPIVGTDYKLVIKNEKGEVVKTEEKVTVKGTDESYYHAFTPSVDGVYTVEAGPEGVKAMRMRVREDTPITSNAQLLEVVQFGTIAWESMETMFWRCESMTFAANIAPPDLTKVTDMIGMFSGCRSFNQPLGKWNVSKVTDMSFMFANCHAFNQPLNNWNVSKVTNMNRMFYDCRAFNQPLNNWDVSKVTNMSGMFDFCHAFNQPLGAWKLQTAIEGLSRTAMSAVNYSLSLIGWAKQTDGASNIQFGKEVKGLIYNDAGKEAREKLIARGWTFEGDVYKPSEKFAISLTKEGEGTLAVEGYNDETLKAVVEGTELTVTATPNDGYTLTSLMAGTQDIFATKKFTVKAAVTVKAVFKKKENNGGGNNGGNNGGGKQPQKPGTAVEDVVLASLVVAPNPFTTQLRIENPEGVAARYELVNASGVVVRTGSFSATEVFVDTEALPAGLYFARLMGQNGAKRVEKVSKY